MNTVQTSAPSAHLLGHGHPADLEACLDLVNSEELDDGVPQEHLPTVDDGIAFFVLRGLGHDEALRAQAAEAPGAWLARLYRTRAALREVFDAQVEGRAPRLQALEIVNEVLRRAPRIELEPGLAGVGVGHRHITEDPTGEALWRVAVPLVDAIASGETERFRICANDGCRWAFRDESRGGRRRWCDMSSCGNRAKVARFRARHRAHDEDAAEPPEAPAAGA